MMNKNLFNKIIDSIGAFLMFLVMIITFYQVLVRYIFKAPSAWSEEFARYIMIWMTMIGAAMALHYKDHVKIETFIKFLSQRMKKIYNFFYFICLIFFTSFICYYGVSFALLNSSQHSPTSPWLSMFWPCISIPVGMGLMIFYILTLIMTGKN